MNTKFKGFEIQIAKGNYPIIQLGKNLQLSERNLAEKTDPDETVLAEIYPEGVTWRGAGITEVQKIDGVWKISRTDAENILVLIKRLEEHEFIPPIFR